MKESIKKRIEAVRRGEVPEGYCRVHPYVIPNDWEVVKLENITKRTSRPNKDRKDRPAYSINNRKGFVPQNEQFEEGSYEDLDKSAYKIVRKGEFAYNPARVNVGSIGRLRNAEEVAVSSLYVCVSVDDKVDGEYFDAWTKSLDFYKETVRNTEGSVREYLFYENFANMRMPIPSRAEQKKIAEILATCDRVIELTQGKIDELNKLKQTCLRKMFPQKGQAVPEARFPGFSDPWKQRKLGDMCEEFQSGSFISASEIYDSGTYPVYGGNGLRGYTESYNHDGVFALIGRQGARCGNMNISKGKAYFTEHAVACKANKSHDTEFLYYLFGTLNLGQYSGQSAQPGLAVGNLVEVVAKAPTKNEQVAIASYFIKLDNLITLHQLELEEYEKYKKALMQLLLTGLVRVNA